MLLKYGASALDVKKAMNDLPTLYPEGVNVAEAPTPDGGKLYTITFAAERGMFNKSQIS